MNGSYHHILVRLSLPSSHKGTEMSGCSLKDTQQGQGWNPGPNSTGAHPSNHAASFKPGPPHILVLYPTISPRETPVSCGQGTFHNTKTRKPDGPLGSTRTLGRPRHAQEHLAWGWLKNDSAVSRRGRASLWVTGSVIDYC